MLVDVGRHPRAGLEDEDLLSGFPEGVGDECAGKARADDDDIPLLFCMLFMSTIVPEPLEGFAAMSR